MQRITAAITVLIVLGAAAGTHGQSQQRRRIVGKTIGEHWQVNGSANSVRTTTATSTLTFTIYNPTGASLSGLNFTDTFPTSPGAMVVANPTGASTTGCGTPTPRPTGSWPSAPQPHSHRGRCPSPGR